jgi:hypothetical protein
MCWWQHDTTSLCSDKQALLHDTRADDTCGHLCSAGPAQHVRTERANLSITGCLHPCAGEAPLAPSNLWQHMYSAHPTPAHTCCSSLWHGSSAGPLLCLLCLCVPDCLHGACHGLRLALTAPGLLQRGTMRTVCCSWDFQGRSCRCRTGCADARHCCSARPAGKSDSCMVATALLDTRGVAAAALQDASIATEAVVAPAA